MNNNKPLWKTDYDTNITFFIEFVKALAEKDAEKLIQQYVSGDDLLSTVIGVGCTCGMVYRVEDHVILAFEQIQLYTHMTNEDYENQGVGESFYNKKKQIYEKYEDIDFDNEKDVLMTELLISIIHGKGLCEDKGYRFTEQGQWLYNNLIFELVGQIEDDEKHSIHMRAIGLNADYEPITEDEKTIDLNKFEHNNCYCLDLIDNQISK